MGRKKAGTAWDGYTAPGPGTAGPEYRKVFQDAAPGHEQQPDRKLVYPAPGKGQKRPKPQKPGA